MRNLLYFWTVLRDEGWYSALDYLAWRYLDDWHVPHRDCRHPR